MDTEGNRKELATEILAKTLASLGHAVTHVHTVTLDQCNSDSPLSIETLSFHWGIKSQRVVPLGFHVNVHCKDHQLNLDEWQFNQI